MFCFHHWDSSTGLGTFCGNDGIPSGSADGSLSKLAFAYLLGSHHSSYTVLFFGVCPPKLFSPYNKVHSLLSFWGRIHVQKASSLIAVHWGVTIEYCGLFDELSVVWFGYSTPAEEICASQWVVVHHLILTSMAFLFRSSGNRNNNFFSNSILQIR